MNYTSAYHHYPQGSSQSHKADGLSPYPSYPTNPTAPTPYQCLSPLQRQSQGGAPFSTHTHNNFYRQGIPTVMYGESFDPNIDAKVLHKALEGFGTNENAIIQVLANRLNTQRLQIEERYKKIFLKDLKENLKNKLSGNFKQLVLALMTPMVEFQAQELHWAMEGAGTDETTLIEFLCSATNYEIHAVQDTYERLFRRTLLNDIMDDTSGYFQNLLVSLCQGRRDVNYAVDEEAAEQDARDLMKAGVLRLGTDEATFIMILCNRSYPQLAQVFKQYEKCSGHEIDKAIISEFSGDIKTALLAIVECVRDKPGFFAEQLYKSMKGLGTDDRALIRLITLRSEVDMVDIKRAFYTKYEQSLKQFIEGDTSGDYRRCLLALINE